MAAIKSIDFLPEIFQTTTNKKFLAATVDQLISEPDFKRIDGYIGRKFAPTFKSTDSYIQEPSVDRQNYQLEASFVVQDSTNNVVFYSSYLDLIQKIKFYGGLTNDHSRLFEGESYNYNGLFDFDKFVNFNQYYWLPDGPPEVVVSADSDVTVLDFTVTRNSTTQGYNFTGYGNDSNPIVTLVKGTTYTFRVGQTSNPFWIQTQSGKSGTRSAEAELLSRTVYGVKNNGDDAGTITFAVPASTAQDDVRLAERIAEVDFATSLTYTQIQHHLLSVLKKSGGIDGAASVALDGRTVIFIKKTTNNDDWTDMGVFDHDQFDQDTPPFEYFEEGMVVPGSDRFDIFRIRVEATTGGNGLVTLEHVQDVEVGKKVYVKGGTVNAGTEFVKEADGFWEPVKPITATLTELYYQDGNSNSFSGIIKLVEPDSKVIDVTSEIIGKKSYTSPNGVKFTNGMKIRFDNTVTPTTYTNNIYIVEGVGKAIRLVSTGNLIVPEEYALGDVLATPDYITVNRGSKDLNAWSRSNRWFHSELISLAAEYNKDPLLLVTTATRARRPIIEFEPDLYLFNYGQRAKAPIDVLDYTVTDAFKQVEGQEKYVIQLPNGVTRPLTAGTRIIFANDNNPEVRKQIYRVDFITVSERTQIHLVTQNTELLPTYYVSGVKLVEDVQVAFVGGNPDTPAAATLQVDSVTGEILDVHFTNYGTGYRSAPTVVFVGGGAGTGAKLDITLSGGSIIDFELTSGGSGYSTSPLYGFVPSVTFSQPIPGVSAVQATGVAVMAPTTVANVSIEYSGLNYIADPYVEISTEYTRAAEITPVYSKYKYIDYVRIEDAGTAVGASPVVSIATPNAHELLSSFSNATAFTSSVLPTNGSGITPGYIVYGPGITANTSVVSNYTGSYVGNILLSQPAFLNFDRAAGTDQHTYVFYPASPSGVTITQSYANTLVFASNVVSVPSISSFAVDWKIYGEGVGPGVTIDDIFVSNSSILLSSTIYQRTGRTIVAKPAGATASVVSNEVRYNTEVEVDTTEPVAAGMYVSGGADPINITAVTQENPVVLTLSTASHGLVDGDSIVIRGAEGAIELNNNKYYVVPVTGTARVQLFSDSNLQYTLDGRNYGAYTGGGYAAGYTIDYGVTVTKVISETKFEVSSAVSLKAGSPLYFIGRRAEAVAKSDGKNIYTVYVTDPGAGYTSVPAIDVTYSSGIAPVVTAVMNDPKLDYFKIVYPGAGYQISNSVSTRIISQVTAEISDAVAHGDRTLVFSSADDIKYVKEDWIALLVTTRNQQTVLTDFARVPYASTEVTGPNPSAYQDYMDVALTNATVLKVASISDNTIVLDGDINAVDSDGVNIDLPAGSSIYFTAKSRFFTDDGTGSGQPVGDVDSSFVIKNVVTDSTTITLNSVAGIQYGMKLTDLSGTLPTGLVVQSVNTADNSIIVNTRVTAAAGIPVAFTAAGAATSNLASTKIERIDIEEPGAEYTSAPTITVEPAIPRVDKVATSTGTALIEVADLDNIVIGMTVTGEYDVDGNGVTTGAQVPKVIGTTIVQTGAETYRYYVNLDVEQPVFTGLLVSFSLATKALAEIESLNVVQTDTEDTTPDTYEADDTVIVSLPTTGQSAIKQRQVGVNTYSQYWFDGTDWLPAQQKTQYNQPPLFDMFTSDGVSASDRTMFPGTKFAGTKIFSYKEGTGARDTQLGFALSYKNFENVGDIEFENNYDVDGFRYLSTSKIEVSRSINTLFAKQKTDSGFVYRNNWTKVTEPTKQYQIISKVFDGLTNYFEIDILPVNSKTVPYVKVFVDNVLLASSQFSIQKYKARTAVVVDEALLVTDPASKVDILIYSDTPSNIGFYQLPANIDYNAENMTFDSMTLGQLRQHLTHMSQNHYGMTGDLLGTNNLRDLDIKGWQGSVLQHASPGLYSAMFLGDKGLEFVESVEYAQKEYSKFKNKFLDQAVKLELNIKDTAQAVDQLMAAINIGKNTTMPWYDSDMIPFGTANVTTTIPIVDARQTRYQIPSAFDNTVLSRRSVLVYLIDTAAKTKRQLIVGTDFTFNTDLGAIDLTSAVTLNYTQQLKIVDYPNTVGCYVPETPTKLGLYPKYVPKIFTDYTYQEPREVLQGHDGSITPTFGDQRDQLLLELEIRIYNNIKADYTRTLLDLVDCIPGKFRTTNYSRREFAQLLTRNFLKWSGVNQVKYAANNTFVGNNAWTWNYRFLKDASGEFLPGFWRGAYQYYYDTDRPHDVPWEMLGFYEKPSWWEDRYGPAPYTGANTVLWDDLEAGYIHAGDRAGIDERFARPGLSKFIPVDEYGSLKSPEKIMVASFDSTRLESSWAVGDHGPVETAWRRSSDFPYALQIAIALSRPAFYFGSMFNTTTYARDTNIGQLVKVDSLQRVTTDAFDIPDDGLKSGTVSLTAGYVNWVRDWFTSKAIDGTAKMKQLIQGVEIKLSYKIAGYTDSKFLTVIADQSSPFNGSSSIVVPPENYKIFLSKGAPVTRIVYSAVIVERSPSGYTVSGYNLENPYFTIIPSVSNNNSITLKVLNETAIVYRNYEPVKITVPYGYEYKTRQQVVDFLISYERYLKGLGMVFDTFAPELETRQDWMLSAKEFLTWSQQGWDTGNLLILSPVFNSIKIVNSNGVIDQVGASTTGSKVLDQNFVTIKNSQYTVSRIENTFTLTSVFGQTIALADLNLVQYEHVLLLDNTTVFNDVIYQPQLGSRQYRLRLIGNKTAAWSGQINPAGFIYNSEVVDEWVSGQNYRRGTLVAYKDSYYYSSADVDAAVEFDFTKWTPIAKDRIKTGLLPNFSNNSGKLISAYDTSNTPADKQLSELAQGITGFRTRSYFQDLNLDTTSQSKFYQGFIKQKGSISAIDALTTAKFDNLFNDVNIYEEWAFRVGDYGALGSDQTIEFQLNETEFLNDPTTVVLRNYNEDNLDGFVNVNKLTLYRTSEDEFNRDPIATRTDIAPRLGDAITAGYPRLDDVDATIFDITDFESHSDLVSQIGAGFKLWVAKDFNKTWNVYRATETNVLITALSMGLDNQVSVITNKPHQLAVGDMFVIKNFDTKDYDGFYQVESILDNTTLTTRLYKNVSKLKALQTITGNGLLLSMVSVRFSTINKLVATTPPHGWRDQDRVWVDNDTAQDVWAVFEKNNGWEFEQILPVRAGDWRVDEGYGRAMKFSNDNKTMLAAAANSSDTSIHSIRIVTSGFLYDSPVVAFSDPESGGTNPRIDLIDSTGALLEGRVTNGGSTYTSAPNVTIIDQATSTVSTSIWNGNLMVLSSVTESVTKTATADVVDSVFVPVSNTTGIWVGDWLTGNDTTGNVVSGSGTGSLFVVNIHHSNSTIQLTETISWSSTTAQSLTFTRYNVFTDDIVTGSDGAGNTIPTGATYTSQTHVSDVNYTTREVTLNRNIYFTAGQTATFSRGTGGNVMAKLTPTTVDSIDVINGGSGFSVTPYIRLVGGGGAGATAEAVLTDTGEIYQITVTNPGSGYTSVPTVEVITTNTSTTVELEVSLTPTTVGSLVVGAGGSGYKRPYITIDAPLSGTRAEGNVNVTNKSVVGYTIRTYGSNYLSRPTATITDSIGSGTGASVEVVFTTGTIKAFRLEEGVIEQVQNIVPFGPDATEFGYDIDIGTSYAFVGAPGSFNDRGAVYVTKNNGGSWQPQQVLHPIGSAAGADALLDGDRFGHSVAISRDQRWLYIGAPLANKVYVYGQKTTQTNQQIITLTTGIATYLTKFIDVKYASEVQVVGSTSGRVFEPNFDYTIQAGAITFTSYATIANETTLYLSQIYPNTIISSPANASSPYTIQGVLQTTYVLSTTPLRPEQVSVTGSDGRVFILNKDYRIDGKVLTFLNTEFTTQAVITAAILEKYYILIDTVEPTDQISWEEGVNVSRYNRKLSTTNSNGNPYVSYIADTLADAEAWLAASGSAALKIDGQLVKVLNLQDDGSYDPYEYYEILSSALVLTGTENTSITRGVAQFGAAIAVTTDGTQIIVGAPTATVNSVPNAGKVYVFDRRTQVFTGTGGLNSVFTTTDALSDATKVTIDGIEVAENVDYTASGQTIIFATAPRNGSKIVVDVNSFNLIQAIETPDPIEQGKFGVTVAIASDNMNIFVGAPGYRDVDYYNGRVYRFINQAKAYGVIVGKNPNIETLQSDTIRINDAEVILQASLGQSIRVVKDILAKGITGVSVRTDSIGQIEFDDTNPSEYTRGFGYFAANVSAVVDAPDQENGELATIGNILLFANGAINTFEITNYGKGYTFAPTVAFTGANTFPAQPTCTIDTGTIKVYTNESARQQSINILPGAGTALSDIGFEIYHLSQVFEHPSAGVPEKYGTTIRVDDQTGETLIVASDGAVTMKSSSFDKGNTVFDQNTTRYIDMLKNAGAVYVYDLLAIPSPTLDNPSDFLYNQTLQNSKINYGDNFGSGLAINDNWIMVGASSSDYYEADAGLVHIFKNNIGKKGWSKLRTRDEKVDIDYINKVFVYDKTTQSIEVSLDYYDPVKGKILGVADQDLDYKTIYDPAIYNRGTNSNVTVDSASPWTEVQLGRTWWNLDVCRYIDYEQGELNYRATYWGQLFPGSTVEVLEWVESLTLPSQYSGDGTPKYPDDSAYVEITFLDQASGLIKTKYYFWVKDKAGVNAVKTHRTNSIVSIQDLIENPTTQDIPYVAVIAPNAFSVYNVNRFVSGDSKILKIDYAQTLNDIIAHSEYELVQEGNPLSTIPPKLISKMIDSLSGENSIGEVVPDLRLKDNEKLGIGIRPRQTMINNTAMANKIVVAYLNSFLKKNLITRLYDISGLRTEEDVPANTSGFYNQVVETVDQLYYIPTTSLLDGYKVLVKSDSSNDGYWTIYEYIASRDIQWQLVRIQSHDATRFWEYADWYATGYSEATQIDYIVNEFKDIAGLTVKKGNVVKVLDDGQGNFELYAIDSTLTPIIVASQNGTIQLSDSLYDSNKSLVGFDNTGFDNIGFAKTAAIEIRNIFNGLSTGVFVGADAIEINRAFFVVLRYILSEQKTVDWAMKTSFLSVVHKIRKLEQFPSYIRDQQDYFEGYINEVKPYRTQVRNYLLDYEGTDYAYTASADFDLAPVYDSNVGYYRALNIKNASDLALVRSSSSVVWLNNYKYSIETIDVVDGGSGYTQAPRVVITNGGGTGATAIATVNTANGAVISVTVSNSGSGFTSQPTITFVGGGGDGARAYARFVQPTDVSYQSQNRLVRSIKTQLNFDRITYNTRVSVWKSYTTYHPGDIVIVESVTNTTFVNLPDQPLPITITPYLVLKKILGAETLDLNLFNDSTVVTKLSGSDITNAIDRLAIYNRPGSPNSAVLYSSPDTQRLDSSKTNDQVFSSGNEWSRVVHSVVVPATHEYQYIAVGRRSLTAISKNGTDWTVVPISENTINLRDAVFYNGTTWISVGNQASMLLSDDAVTWEKEVVDQFRFSPSADNPAGALQLNASQTVDFTAVTAISTTRANYVMAVGNGNNILVNPYGTSADVSQQWYSIKPQTGIFTVPNQLLAVASIPFGDLTDVDGTTYSVNLETSGYHTVKNRLLGTWNAFANAPALSNSTTDGLENGDAYQVSIAGAVNFGAGSITFAKGDYVVWNTATSAWTKSTTLTLTKMQQGFVIVGGDNGNFYITSYSRIDDTIQGFAKRYNYDLGKKLDQNYPWIPMSVPDEIRGIGDGVSGEQVNGIAMSGQSDRWIVAVGSNATLLWNRLDSPIQLQPGSIQLATDTDDKFVIDYGIEVFDNFRYFNSSNFEYPLTPEQLVGINFTDVTWDGGKFVVAGDKSTVIWGYPGNESEATINLGNLNPSDVVTTRNRTAQWSAVTNGTSLVIEVPQVSIDGTILVGMSVSSTYLPTDSVVTSFVASTMLDPTVDPLSAATIDSWEITIEFATATVTARTLQSFVMSYVFTDDISSGTTLTFTGPDGAIKTLVTSSAASKGDTSVKVTNFADVGANWTIAGTGIPEGARVKSVSKFANFTWKYARGSGRDINVDYNSVSVNTTTLQLSQPFTENIPAGSVLTFYDATGTKSQATTSQFLNKNTTTLAFESTTGIETGFTLEPDATFGIVGGVTVVSTVVYNIAGVLDHLAKDIPDLIPGTSYDGVKVTGQGYTDTATDMLSLDTTITSQYTDAELGVRPEDIIINGGKFIDTYSSHAPEELVPGQVIDSLQMNVFTANVGSDGRPDYGNVIAYKIFTDYKLPTSYYRLPAANTTTLAAPLNWDDEEIAVDDIDKLPDPSPAINQPGSIWVNGEKINYFGRDTNRGVLTGIRRGANRTSIPLVHDTGSIVTDASSSQQVEIDSLLDITSDVSVNNGFSGTANTAVYRSAVVSSIPQGQIWFNRS